MKRLLLLLLAALLLLPACTAEPRMEDEFLFYYRAEENAEGVLCAERAELDVSGVSLAQLMEKYLRGPRAKNLLPAVPADWQLLSAELEADTAVLAFDAPVPDHPAIETSLARAAIARTLLQLETVQKVTISLSGSGETVTLTAKDILYTDTSQQTQQEQIVLYFPDDAGRYLRRETVLVDAMDAAQKPEFILRRLLSANEGEANPSGIPSGTVLLDVSVENGICTANFSSQFVTGMTEGFLATRLALYAIVDSLTELPQVHSVDLWVSGAPLDSLGLLDLSAGIRRDESLIAAQESSETLDVTIYPAAAEAALLVPVQRRIAVSPETVAAQTVLETLITFEGGNGIRSFVPAGTKILSVKLENDICTVDLTREFLDGCLSLRQEELAVRSVIATLTAMDGIRSVELLVEGIQPQYQNAGLSQLHRAQAAWFAE